MRVLLPGNCYCWALLMKCVYGGRIFTKTEQDENGEDYTHYLLKSRNGTIRHFFKVYDFFPKPICNYIFIGAFDRSGKKKIKKSKLRKKFLSNA